MKFLVLLLLTSLSFPAFADKLLLKSYGQYEMWGSSSATVEFKVNPELGRAWVELTTYQGEESNNLRVKVSGLTYEQLTETISIDHLGKITVCAEFKVVGRFIFKHKLLKLTSACEFQQRWREVSYDDGFEIKKTRRLDIFLVVKE
jgi:hypothetical protein